VNHALDPGKGIGSNGQHEALVPDGDKRILEMAGHRRIIEHALKLAFHPLLGFFPSFSNRGQIGARPVRHLVRRLELPGQGSQKIRRGRKARRQLAETRIIRCLSGKSASDFLALVHQADEGENRRHLEHRSLHGKMFDERVGRFQAVKGKRPEGFQKPGHFRHMRQLGFDPLPVPEGPALRNPLFSFFRLGRPGHQGEEFIKFQFPDGSVEAAVGDVFIFHHAHILHYNRGSGHGKF